MLGVGTPIIWYGALAALLAMIVWYVATRDWRAGAVLLAYAVGWLPWFYYAIADNRTMYPVLRDPHGAVHGAGARAARRAGHRAGGRRAQPAGGRGRGRRGLHAARADQLRWLYPVLVAEVIPHSQWWTRMLFRSWA